MKQLTVKSAEKWLDKLKNENQQSYKDLTKFLRKYEKFEDQYDCYMKISHTLLSHCDLTKDLNNYLEEGNKFVVNKPEDQKIKDFITYTKQNRADIFKKISEMIVQLSRSKNQSSTSNESLKPRLKAIVKGDEQMEKITEEALDLSGQQLISRKDMDFLKTNKNEEEFPVPPQPTVITQRITQPVKHPPKPPIYYGGILTPSEEKTIFRQISKILDEESYGHIVKIIKLFNLNIITKSETYELLASIQLEEYYIDFLKDILETRQTERRKLSVFKPLNDMNFSNSERATPSYVTFPQYYPIICKYRNESLKKILNDQWVSVPHGSEENDNFSVRNKNMNEINLLKAEDQRYQFDLIMRRLEVSVSLIDKIIDTTKEKTDLQLEILVKKFISLGIIQLIYKNGHREQKQELECDMKLNSIESCKVLRERIVSQIIQLKNIKQVHADKTWNEVASKNFHKALDLKGFEFKKNEKDKMRSNFLINEINERNKLVVSGGQTKNTHLLFEDKKQFFSILNSFEISSRTERCTSRMQPQVESFDLKDEKKRHLYPVMILAFEDESICDKIYSFILYYIDASAWSEQEKLRCKMFLEQFLVNYLGWNLPTRLNLSQDFNEERLYNKILSLNPQNNIKMQEEVDTSTWLIYTKQESLLTEKDTQNQSSKFNYHQNEPSNYSYLPEKDENKQILYSSESVYTLVRFIYAVYERFIKMREVSMNQQRIKQFQLLFFASIKAKESLKFEENLNSLFGCHAYLFTTIYKLFDNLLKSIVSSTNCTLTNYSIKLTKQSSEEIYFVLINRFCLLNSITNNKIVRFTYEKNKKVLYLNYLDSYYKTEEPIKENIKKRADINKQIEFYTFDSFSINEKRRKEKEVFEENRMEYIFQGSTIKMLNHTENQDMVIFTGKKPNLQKMMKRELKRSHKLITKIN